VYLRPRDYDPKTAQFLTIDPLVDTTRQPYAYVADDPLTQTDPSGCDPFTDFENWAAVSLMHGPGAAVASVLEGIGDGASFGLTQSIRQVMGTDCNVQKDGFYFAGLIGGAIASSVVTAGFGGVGDAADAGEAAEDVGSELGNVAEDEGGAAAEDARDAADDASDVCTGGESFAPDALVVLASGRTEPISEIKIGQRVKAVDTNTGKSVIRKVTALWVKRDTDLMDVTITSSAGVASTIHATTHHLFWDLTTHTWVEADRLQAGDRLRSDDGTTVTFTASTVVSAAADMWDLTINGVHDFYVTTGSVAVLVHNETCSLDQMSKSGGELDPQSGLTRAGRALQKHTSRADSGAFSSSSRSQTVLNSEGQFALDDILTDPQGKLEELNRVINAFDSTGRGARFALDGTFMGFLEPR
jgi:hypothetical protein